jgi:hypothetical protein
VASELALHLEAARDYEEAIRYLVLASENASNELYDLAQQRVQKRGLINIQRLHSRYNPEVWRNTSELITIIREINDVMRKEASVIRDMRSLPEQEQVQFWRQEFMPLVAQEHALRERLLVAGQKVSQERSTQ